jgi:hypothetical protein
LILRCNHYLELSPQCAGEMGNSNLFSKISLQFRRGALGRDRRSKVCQRDLPNALQIARQVRSVRLLAESDLMTRACETKRRVAEPRTRMELNLRRVRLKHKFCCCDKVGRAPKFRLGEHWGIRRSGTASLSEANKLADLRSKRQAPAMTSLSKGNDAP